AATANISPRVDADVKTVIGGNFSPDALSPRVFDATLRRVRAAPSAPIAALERIVRTMDAHMLSAMYPEGLLDRLPVVALTETNRAARDLLPFSERAMLAPEVDPYQRARLQMQIDALKRLAR